MEPAPAAVFLIDLVQDVSVLRPLVHMATRNFGFDALLLASARFSSRDLLGIWRSELEMIAAATGARLEYFENDWQASQQLNSQGLLFSASESSLPNHAITHDIFRHAPGRYLRVTVQHGFECVGFRQSAEHDSAHGVTATFAADILCAWSAIEQLTSLAPSQRAKVVVTGPTSVLQLPSEPFERETGAPGLVCENLHSVRLSGADHVKGEFVAAFDAFAELMANRGRDIALRPHPGGQYALKHGLSLPKNVKARNDPGYRLDLRQFAYGISPPSSVLFDMLLAQIPTAVWCDSHRSIDASAYDGLPKISGADEWLDFATAAERDPQPFLLDQKLFLQRQHMPLEPQDVFGRFAELFHSAKRRTAG